MRFSPPGAARAAPSSRPDAVLSPEHRLRRRSDFTDVVRRGRRASRPLLTVHLLAAAEPPPDPVAAATPTTAAAAPARAGLVVSKAVGGSVVRTRVARRLRHQLRPLLAELPAGTRLVVRAAPAVATADSAAIEADLRAAVTRLLPTTSEAAVARAATSSDAT